MLVQTKDGSCTLFSTKYNQHYHNINDGAISEALHKHIIPALTFHSNKQELNILDICFGLGYNTFATIWYILQQNLPIKANFFSPELDFELIESLKEFVYPKEFETIMPIIKEFLENRHYKDKNFEINLFIGDAREYIKKLKNIDIVYQDAFSSDVNSKLWSVEYFKTLYDVCNKDVILTTYSIATPVRLALNEANFLVYEHLANSKKISLAFKNRQVKVGTLVDLELKKQRNPNAKAIYD